MLTRIFVFAASQKNRTFLSNFKFFYLLINKFSHQKFIIDHHSEISSTNDFALELIKNNQAISNQVILSDAQNGGKGRLGRSWISPQGNLYFSIILKIPEGIDFSNLSFVAAVALGEAINLKKINYKWPNDILLEGKKIAGILLEKDGDFLVIGIGVNLISNPTKTNYPAGNLKDLGIDLEKTDLLKSFLDQFSNLQQKWHSFGFSPIRNLWLLRAWNVGKEINANLQNESIKGIFKDLDQNGNLILNVDNQDLIISSGEIF
ncbi:MAG: BirA family biotin operon repressor/biotin-[acetyl-CoA-carboxylase] ligase [Rickettsiales bacterium]